MKNNENYSVGYEEHVLKLFSKRSAYVEAKFLLPYIKPNSDILDCGCGIGSITIDFAKIANHGKVTGIDLNVDQAAVTKQYSESLHIDNLEFKAASIYELPFADNSFDIVYSNAVLCQLKTPDLALKEMLRVTKSGGYIAARDMDWGATIMYPCSDILEEAVRIREEAITALGANYRIGRQLRSIFIEAGLVNVQGSADAEYIGNTHTIKEITNYISKQWDIAPFATKAQELGLVTKEKIKLYQNELAKFANNEGAFQAWLWCHAIGQKSSN